ncbi:MAG: hemolysin family protein [Betaproteobacteria bacterium]
MDILILAFLILLNGGFSMAEIAVVSARKSRLQQSAEEGDTGAAAALALASDPSHFLSTTQVGITSIGILSGAFGEATLSKSLGQALAQIPLIAPYSNAIALAIVVLIITYVSLIIGELVPKRLALHNPEAFASAAARPMAALSRVAFPLVRILSASTDFVIKVLGARASTEPPVSEAEINVLMEQGAEAGVFEETEKQIVSNILRLDEQRIGALMTPRLDILFLDIEDAYEDNRHKLIESPYSRLPVCKGGTDNVLGIVQAKELLARALSGQPFDLLSSVRPPLYVPNSITAMQLLETFKKNGYHVALVVDEYGELQGLVTMNDVLEAIVGDIGSEDTQTDPLAVKREDGSWLLDGMLPVEDFKKLFDIDELPDEESGSYHTISGFVMMQLGRVPVVPDHFEWGGFRFEVVDMDRSRIDKVLVAPAKLPDPREANASAPQAH